MTLSSEIILALAKKFFPHLTPRYGELCVWAVLASKQRKQK